MHAVLTQRLLATELAPEPFPLLFPCVFSPRDPARVLDVGAELSSPLPARAPSPGILKGTV